MNLRTPKWDRVSGGMQRDKDPNRVRLQRCLSSMAQAAAMTTKIAIHIGGSACCYDLHLAAFGTSWTARMSVSTSAGFAD